MEDDPDHRLMAVIDSGNRKFILVEALRTLCTDPEHFLGL